MQVRINTPINTSINTYANVINQTLLNSTNLVSSEAKPSTKKQAAGIASGNTWNAQRVGASGLGGGVSAELQGGNFKDGFAGGFVGSAAGGMMDKGNNWSDIAGRTAISAAAGGVAAELGGGKFSNGARSAAFVHLFNHEAGRRHRHSSLGKSRNDPNVTRALGVIVTAPFGGAVVGATAGVGRFIAVYGSRIVDGIKNFYYSGVASGLTVMSNPVYIQRGVDFVNGYFVDGPANNIPSAVGTGTSRLIDSMSK